MTLDFSIPHDEAAGRTRDRLAIADCAHVYAAAVDLLGNHPAPAVGVDAALQQASELMARCLTPDAQLRLFLDGPHGIPAPLGAGGPAAVAQAVRDYFSAYGYVGTQHNVANLRVAFTGPDTAVATSQIPCYHWLADGRLLLTPVSYRDALQRRDGVWRIARRDIQALRFWVASGGSPNPLDPALAAPR